MTMVISYTSLEVAYVLWLMLTIVGTFLVIRYLPNSPYHQLLEYGVPHSVNVQISNWLGQKIIPNVTVTLKQVARKWKVWVLVYIYFVSFGGFLALTVYLPIFNLEYHKTTPREAGLFTASYSIFASLSRAMTGKLIDRVGGGICTIYGLCFIMIGSVILAMSPP